MFTDIKRKIISEEHQLKHQRKINQKEIEATNKVNNKQRIFLKINFTIK